MEKSAPPSSSPSPRDELVDGVIKAFVCVAGCEDPFHAFRAACLRNSDFPAGTTPAAPKVVDVEACTKAAAALRSCMQASGDVYDSYVNDMAKQQEEAS